MQLWASLTWVTLLVTALSGPVQARNSLDKFVSKAHNEHSQTLTFYSKIQRQNSFQACANQFPKHRPFELRLIPKKWNPLALCSDNFAVLYSQTSKTPLIVVEKLNAARIKNAKNEERSNHFYPDPRIPKSGRAELSDYKNAKIPVDRGHLSPAANSPSEKSMVQSFALSNMVPQDQKLNRGSWSRIESDVRKFAVRTQGNVFVFTGPIFDKGYITIGKNKIWKPTRLFKLVYHEDTGRAWAYVIQNSNVKVSKPLDYSNFVNITGLPLLDGLKVTGSIEPR